MRLLYLHSDFMEYKPISKEIKDAEEIVSNDKVKFDDLVVTLVAVENGDNERVLNEATEDVRKYLSTVKSRTVLIYPYAHLSSNLAPPEEAFEILRSFEEAAKKSLSLTEVHRAPFGWTKAFNIKVKGHPLAENAREIRSDSNTSLKSEELKGEGLVFPSSSDTNQFATDRIDSGEGQISTALKAEEKLESSWYIFDTRTQINESKLIPISEYQFKKDQVNLRKLASYELQKK